MKIIKFLTNYFNDLKFRFINPSKDENKSEAFTKKKKRRFKWFNELKITSLKGILCEYCYKSMSIDNRFFCKYSEKYHCNYHRLPEEHNCPNPNLPLSMRKSGVERGGRIEGK